MCMLLLCSDIVAREGEYILFSLRCTVGMFACLPTWMCQPFYVLPCTHPYCG